jgi:hypothetical protein
VYPADRTVLSEPALPGSVMDHPAARRALRPSYPLDDQPTQAAPNQISGRGGIHPPILPRPAHGRRKLAERA